VARSLEERLRSELGEADFQLLMKATDQGRKLPFGPCAAELESSVLMDADDALLDILARCESVLTDADIEGQTGPPAPAEESFRFSFEAEGPELDHFLASLQKNSFSATTVIDGEVHVFVRLEGLSDLEFFRLREMLRSLYEITAVVKGKRPKGHRLY